MICHTGDIVSVLFSFVDSPHTKKRPALVLSKKKFNTDNGHTLLAMITTGEGFSWISDISILNVKKTGLPVPSIVRMKLFTLDNRLVLSCIGKTDTKDLQCVHKTIKKNILGCT
jgi:mRNA interferase MazF